MDTPVRKNCTMIKVSAYIYFMFDLKTLHGYVGKSVDPERRVKEHWDNKYKESSYKNHWLCTLSSAPQSKILKECTQKNWQKEEKHWVAKMKEEGWTLTNMTDGGDGSNGCIPSEETRKKMSMNHVDCEGHTDETKKKISESLMGYKHSSETRRKMRRSQLGNRNAKGGKGFLGCGHSEESVEKMRISSTGIKHTKETKKKMSASQRKRRINERMM